MIPLLFLAGKPTPPPAPTEPDGKWTGRPGAAHGPAQVVFPLLSRGCNRWSGPEGSEGWQCRWGGHEPFLQARQGQPGTVLGQPRRQPFSGQFGRREGT